MDDKRIERAPSGGFGPWKTTWKTHWKRWTPRIVVWTIACVTGLWLGTGSRPAAAHGQVAQPSEGYQASLADVFRWDILLAGKESPAPPVYTKAVPTKQFKLPQTLLCALRQRPEPVPSTFPQRLSGVHPRFHFAPPSKPAGGWRMQWDERMALLEHRQEGLRVVLQTVPGLSPADRRSIQAQVDKACAQVGSLRMQQAARMPEPPEPLLDLPKDWPEPPSMPVMP